MNVMYLLWLIPVVLMIPLGIYFFFYLKRTAEFFKLDTRKKSIKIILIVITLIISAMCTNVWGTLTMVMFHIIMLSVCIDIINLIVRALGKKMALEGIGSRWHTLYRSGFMPVIGTLIILSLGFVNIENIVETDYSIYTVKNIREEGYRVAMISDLHYGTFMDRDELIEACEKIQKTGPDIVLLCGDIVEEATTYDKMEEAFEILGSISSTYGVFFVYGNHDLSPYKTTPYYSRQELEDSLSKNGIKLLVDESYEINNDLVIVGRDDVKYGVDSDRKSGAELLNNINMNKFILLMDHQPIELQQNSDLGYDLQLSGHTHAGQIWPVGYVSEGLGLVEKNYGHKKIGNYQIIVSSGIVGWGYPVRTGSNSEYVIVDIKKE